MLSVCPVCDEVKVKITVDDELQSQCCLLVSPMPMDENGSVSLFNTTRLQRDLFFFAAI